MPNAVHRKYDAAAAFTITLASLATVTSRASAAVANGSFRPGAMIFLALKSGGTAPTAGTTYEIYLLRSDDHASQVADDNWGETDAAITIENAPLLGSIVVTATINKVFYKTFDTGPLGPLGDNWGIAVRNATNQSMHATEADHLKHYRYYYDEIQ